MARDFIKLPTLEELPSLSEGFFNLAPKVETVLVVDDSYILIYKPSANGTRYFLQEKILRDQCSVFLWISGKKLVLLLAGMERIMILGYIGIPIIFKIMLKSCRQDFIF